MLVHHLQCALCFLVCVLSGAEDAFQQQPGVVDRGAQQHHDDRLVKVITDAVEETADIMRFHSTRAHAKRQVSARPPNARKARDTKMIRPSFQEPAYLMQLLSGDEKGERKPRPDVDIRFTPHQPFLFSKAAMLSEEYPSSLRGDYVHRYQYEKSEAATQPGYEEHDVAPLHGALSAPYPVYEKISSAPEHYFPLLDSDLYDDLNKPVVYWVDNDASSSCDCRSCVWWSIFFEVVCSILWGLLAVMVGLLLYDKCIYKALPWLSARKQPSQDVESPGQTTGD